jgi:hypothetical protein
VVLWYSQGSDQAAAAGGLTVPTAEMCHYSGTAHLQQRQEVKVYYSSKINTIEGQQVNYSAWKKTGNTAHLKVVGNQKVGGSGMC